MPWAHYLAETLVENRLDALLKPVVGRLSDRDRPSYQTEDKYPGSFSLEPGYLLIRLTVR